MICHKCGADNPEDSIFCSKCGNRLDGKCYCKQCGKINSDDNKFCTYCGAELHADKGTKHQPAEPSVFQGFDYPKSKTGSVQVGLSISAFITGCLTVLFSLIFTFFIGAKVTANGVSSGNFIDIFYYFSAVYEEFASSSVAMYGQIGAAIGTISALFVVIGIVVTILIFADSIIKFFNHKIKSLTKYAIVAYFIYIAGVSLFMFNSHTSLSISSDYSSGVSALTLNGATIAGIILGGLTLIATIVLETVIIVVLNVSKSSISQSITTCISMVFGVIILSLLGCGILTVSEEGVTMSTGVLPFFETVFFTAASTDQNSTQLWTEFTTNFYGSVAIVYFMFIIALLFIIMFILMMKHQLTDFGFGYKKKILPFGIIDSICSIAIGIFQIMLASFYGSYFFLTESYVLTVPIILIVMGILLLINTIVSQSLYSKYSKEVNYYSI